MGEPGFTPESDALGARGTQLLRFDPVAEAGTTLRLVYYRPWEEADPEQTFSVDVVIR